jgi:Zn-finger nucleic acid-binding protein
MIVLELQQVEVDHCLTCGGIWLDGGELELLLGDSAQLVGLFQPVDVKEKTCGEPAERVEPIRRCPICLKKMQKVAADSADKSVIIDRCSKSHGLWFDKNELPQVLAAGNLDKEQKIIKLLSEIFGNKESEVKNGG